MLNDVQCGSKYPVSSADSHCEAASAYSINLFFKLNLLICLRKIVVQLVQPNHGLLVYRVNGNQTVLKLKWIYMKNIYLVCNHESYLVYT